jgi:hypothetical protein
VQRVRRRLGSRLGLLLLSTLLSVRLAAAQTAQTATPSTCPDPDATLCGRFHFETGTKAFERGDFAGAAAEFQAAMEQRPHPVIRFNLALSLARLGHPRAAIEHLTHVQNDTSADRELRERAAREQKSAEQALARVTFRLSDASREHVELDGAPVTLEVGQELVLDPGSHHVKVVSNSSVVLDQELDLSPGERVELRVGERSRRIDVVVVSDPPGAKPKPPKPEQSPPKPPKPKPVPTATRPLPPAWFYGGVGATVVVTGLAVWSGVDTLSALDDYERDLPQLTQPQADARVREGHARELRTNLLIGGSVLCGVGTAALGLWFVDFSGQQRTRVAVSPTGLAVSGSF